MSGQRRPLVAGNWKMHKTAGEATEFCVALAALLGPDPVAEAAVCPPFTALDAAVRALAGTRIEVYGQNVHEAAGGAHTGEISAAMLTSAGVDGVLVGHSERRAAGDTDEQVADRVRAALDAGLRVVLCCGESLDTRRAVETGQWLTRQVRSALAHVHAADIDRLVIAYEPIWAIGTGETASPEQAQEACAIVRSVAAERVDGECLRVLYGGSVNAGNAAELMSQTDVDGALVGGASLEPEWFAQIVLAAA
jgi:triosephosphate isomerase